MGQEVREVSETAPLAPAEQGGQAAAQRPGGERSASAGREPRGSIGRYLASQRCLRGISLDELAMLTKIPRRSLERLEGGAFDATPDGFARGFVRTVAEALGLDPDEAVMRLMSEPGDDEVELRGRAILRQRTMFGRAAAVAGVALVAVVLWKLVGAWLAPAADPPETELIFRRDPVRALAQEEAARAGAGERPGALAFPDADAPNRGADPALGGLR